MKTLLNIICILFGLFMLLNAGIVLYRYLTNAPWEISSSERLVSAIVTGIVGILLLVQTFRSRKSKPQ